MVLSLEGTSVRFGYRSGQRSKVRELLRYLSLSDLWQVCAASQASIQQSLQSVLGAFSFSYIRLGNRG